MVASLSASSVLDWDLDGTITTGPADVVAMLETAYGSISFGDIDNVNDESFSEVAGMTVVEGDFGVGGAGTVAHEVRAETTLGGYSIAASTDFASTNVALQVSGSTGSVDFALYYETDIMGFTASTAVGGMDLAFAYADDTAAAETSFGVGVGYTLSSTISVSGSYASNTTGVDQIAVGVAYDGGAITASADFDVDASVLDLAAGYTMEVQAGTTVTVGVTVDDATGASTVGYSVDIAHVVGDLGVYAGYDDVDGTYVGANYDLGGGASAFVYTADGADRGPLEWNGAKAGIALTF